MAFYIKNIDTVNVDIGDVGISLIPNEQYDLSQDEADVIAKSTDLPAAITGGSIAVLDPLDDVTQLSTSDALEAVSVMNDTHWRIKGGYIDQLGDVNTTGRSDGQFLYFNNSSSNFEPATISNGSGISVNLAAGVLTITNTDPNTDQNLFDTVNADTGTSTANSTNDSFNILGGTGISTAIVGDSVTITNTSPHIDQNLWETIAGDTGSTAADSATDTIAIVGGSGISTAIIGDTLTITNTLPGSSQNVFDKFTDGTNTATADTTTDTFTFTAGTGVTLLINETLDSLTITNTDPNVDQNLWETIAGDTGSTAATSTTDTFNVVGGTGISTAVVGDTLTINATGGTSDELVKISANDTTAGYLNGKLVAGSGITLTENNDGGNETLTITSTGTAPNLWATFTADSGSTTADTTADTLTVVGGTGISTSITGDNLTITNDSPNVDQNLYETFTGDTGSTTANTSTDTLNIAGGTSITTSVTGDTVTINNDAPNVDQNIWETITADTGSTTANTTTDTLNVVGGTGITTSITGDTLTISSGNSFGIVTGDTGTANSDTPNDTISIVGGNKITTTAGDTPDTLTIDWTSLSINELTDVDNAGSPQPTNNATLKFNTTTGNWEPQPSQPAPPSGSEASVQLKWGPINSASGTSSIPKDSTTPLITEGFEIWNRNMTLQEPLSNVRIATNVTFSSSNSSLELVFAVFRDSTCIGTVVNSTSNKSSGFAISFELYDTPNPDPGGSPMYTYNYSCRVGRTGSGTWYINSIHNNTPITYFGGTLTSNSYSIEEMGIIE